MSFPSLQGQVPIQYRSFRTSPSQYVPHEFVGNQRRACILSDSGVKGWALRYDALVLKEVNQLRTFYESTPALGAFAFTDPWTGLQHDQVRFSANGLTLRQDGPDSFHVECELEEAS
jgi:hypothetical protein